jgi:hypothetical protein
MTVTNDINALRKIYRVLVFLMFLSFDRRSIGLKKVSRTGFKLILLEIFPELYFLDSFVE